MNLIEEENLTQQLKKYLMISQIKKILYFPIAYYFRIFAQIQLFLWKPKIIVITGSNAKTTMLHLLESQIGNKARYSHHANSSYGIPFDILGLSRKTLTLDEWPKLFLMAPFQAFKKTPEQKLYIVEADCDRPEEGQFLSTLLKPEVTIWLSSSKTHGMNFKKPVEENIAYEFGFFVQHTKKLVIVNGDSFQIKNQLKRTKANIIEIHKKDLKKYKISKDYTNFEIDDKTCHLNCLLPEESLYQIKSTIKILEYLNLPLDSSFKNFQLPPGRTSKFIGIKNTILIDSSYNANLSSMNVILEMFNKIPVTNKWVVLGDMLEQGSEEQTEHEKLAELLSKYNFNRVILMGPRVSKYTYPKLKDAVKFEKPAEVLGYLQNNIKGGETILFKGARFLEGIIENLLQNKQDISKLCRREKIWQERRKEWGL